MTVSLMRRIAFTIAGLRIYRLGLQIPLPGLDPSVLAGPHPLVRVSILTIGIAPYVVSAVLLPFATFVSPRPRSLPGEQGRAAFVRRTRHLAALLTAFQAWGIAVALPRVAGVVTEPGWPFVVSTIFRGSVVGTERKCPAIPASTQA